jgi:hypothetical protein
LSFTHERYCQLRPFLYHLTAAQNLERIRKTGRLVSAQDLVIAAQLARFLAEKRLRGREILIAGETVHIRDQSPLYEANIRFGDGWSFRDLLTELNKRVFFWAGTVSGPIAYGERHFARYREERPVILRLPFNQLIARNQEIEPFYCKFNSGSPRCSGGIGSLRDSDTFATGERADFTPGRVVEVTFVESVLLPDSTQVGNSPNGPWRRLF